MIGKGSWAALAGMLASAGLGLLLWLGISIALLQGGGAEMALLRSMQHSGLLFACVLTLAAVYELRSASSHGSSERWRRLAVLALAVALSSAVALMVLLMRRPPDAGWVTLAAGLSSLGAIGAVLALGMLTASAGRPQWRQQVVAPSRLAYALLAGAALLFALIAIRWPGQQMHSAPAPSMVMLLLVMGALKLLYWFENGGLRVQVVSLAAADALRLRLGVLALLALVPLLFCAGLVLWPDLAPKTGWCAIALAVLAGGYLDRQLLAAEAGSPSGVDDSPVAAPASEK
jgi:hypothetical protein